MPQSTLTPKQEKFVLVWIETSNKTEAYRQAYNASGMTEESINVKASELSKTVKVAGRYAELTKAAQERTGTTVDALDRMLRQAYEVATNDVKPAAMVSAVAALAKLHGLDAEIQMRMKAEAKGAGKDEGVPNIIFRKDV